MKDINLTRLIIFVFIISWVGVLPSLLISYGVNLPEWFKALNIFMTLGPLLGAVLFIYRAQGKQGLKKFFSRFLIFRASKWVILIAIGLPFLISFLGSYLGLKFSGTPWPAEFTYAHILKTGAITFLMYLIVNTEELVWRGIVFDKFYNKYGYIKACLILIPIWGIFHLPLFFYPGGHLAGYGILDFAFLVIPSTFILGWIYINSNRSLFYVHIHHQLINGVGQAFPLFPVFIGGLLLPVRILCGILLLMCVIIIIQHKRHQKSLSH